VTDTEEAVVALGANLGAPEAALPRAAARLARLGEVVAASTLFASAAVGGPAGQPPYRNAVLVLRPAWPWRDPTRLMAALLAVEAAAGRRRRVRWGPRVLDLDLISFGERRSTTADLTLPHPRAAQRPFVLAPLAQVWPDWRWFDGRTAGELLVEVLRDGSEVRDTGLPLLAGARPGTLGAVGAAATPRHGRPGAGGRGHADCGHAGCGDAGRGDARRGHDE
jgi:2-amino-4-hydroxy-6-hydroxymethyldihydropteridine diphosphokinase